MNQAMGSFSIIQDVIQVKLVTDNTHAIVRVGQILGLQSPPHGSLSHQVVKSDGTIRFIDPTAL